MCDLGYGCIWITGLSDSVFCHFRWWGGTSTCWLVHSDSWEALTDTERGWTGLHVSALLAYFWNAVTTILTLAVAQWFLNSKAPLVYGMVSICNLSKENIWCKTISTFIYNWIIHIIKKCWNINLMTLQMLTASPREKDETLFTCRTSFWKRKKKELYLHALDELGDVDWVCMILTVYMLGSSVIYLFIYFLILSSVLSECIYQYIWCLFNEVSS